MSDNDYEVRDADREYQILKEENERLREALRYVRRTINPIGSWVTIGKAVPMVDNAIACIDAALERLVAVGEKDHE